MDLLYVVGEIKKRRWVVLGIVLPATVLAFALSLLMPKKYLSEASVLPVNSLLTDKGRLFNENLQQLYSGFGTADDLDRLYAVAKSGVVYNAIADSFQLIQHYKLQDKGLAARNTALKRLRSNSYILKTEYGELKIGVWDKDPQLAAGMANAMVRKIQEVNQDLFREFYSAALDKLKKVAEEKSMALEKAKTAGEKNTGNSSSSVKLLQEEADRYQKLVGEFTVAEMTPPPALMVLEKAHPSLKPDKPDVLLNTAAVFIISALAAVTVVSFFSRK